MPSAADFQGKASLNLTLVMCAGEYATFYQNA